MPNGQKRFTQAEPLPLDGYRTLEKLQGTINPRTQIGRQRLVALYEVYRRVDKADQHRSELGSR